MQIIKIKYFNENQEKLNKIEIGDWIDLRASQSFEYGSGEFMLIPLGIAMQLPEGYEANIVPRSSTFKKYGVIQTNSFGVVDESYAGDNDQWFMPVYSLKAGRINEGDRICQFRINKKMEDIEFVEVQVLGNQDRGGHGSTGNK